MKHDADSMQVVFILKIEQILHAVSVSDFPPGSICSLQLDAASVKNKLYMSILCGELLLGRFCNVP